MNALVKRSNLGITPLAKDCQSESCKAKPACFNRSVKDKASTVTIKVDKSQKMEEAISIGLNKRATFKYLPFEIKGNFFRLINGNERDHDVAKNLDQDTLEKDVSFNVITPDSSCEYKPSKIWQERFLRCVNQGLQNIFDVLPPDTVLPLKEGRTAYDIFGISKIPPTCMQFVTFIECGSTSFSDTPSFDAEPLEKPELKDNFTTLGLLTDKNPVHCFIHIGDGVCIGKLGIGCICFHTIEDILSFYSKYHEQPLKLAVLKRTPSSLIE